MTTLHVIATNMRASTPVVVVADFGDGTPEIIRAEADSRAAQVRDFSKLKFRTEPNTRSPR